MAERIRTIATGGSYETVIRKSRFICTLERVTSEEEGKAFLAAMRKQYWDASHNCSAWVMGSRGELQRSNDDGEPSGTAGLPMLTALNHRALTDVAAVVTRYFGGTLLGAGGLIRAYGQSVTEAINTVGIVERKPMTIMLVESPHHLAGRLDFALRGSPYQVGEIDYAEEVSFELHLTEDEVEPFHEWLGEATGGQVTAEIVGTEFVEVPVLEEEP